MNSLIKREFVNAIVILFLVKFNYQVLGQNNSDNSNGTGLISTYKSTPEVIIKDLVSALDSGGNSSSIITRTFSEVLEAVADQVQLVFPGTEWCGDGDDAQDENDLGYFNYTDGCCRNHDTCPGFLVAGSSEGPLINDGIFTRSTCECDHKFYDCLKGVNTDVSAAIGDTYFNLLRPQCYAEDYPIESCAEREGDGSDSEKCVKYNFDTSGNQTLQWFDNPDF